MSALKRTARSILSREHHKIGEPAYSIIRAGLNEIDTLAERDVELEELWADLQDVVFDDSDPNEDMKLLDPWGGFPARTSRDDIWHWFDERHSKGVAYLLYGNGVDRTEELSRLAVRRMLCEYCGSEDCGYNEYGICHLPMVFGRRPDIEDDGSCNDYIFREA